MLPVIMAFHCGPCNGGSPNTETEALTTWLESHAVFYTPPVVNTPTQVERDIRELRSDLRAILVEDRQRVQRAHLDEIQQHEREAEEERQQRILTELDWFATRIPERFKKPESRWVQLSIDYDREISKIADPTTLVIIDEADRLKMSLYSTFDLPHLGHHAFQVSCFRHGQYLGMMRRLA